MKPNMSSKLIRALTKVGVTLNVSPTVPLFEADPRDPTLIRRKLNGVITRGRFVDGKFIEVK